MSCANCTDTPNKKPTVYMSAFVELLESLGVDSEVLEGFDITVVPTYRLGIWTVNLMVQNAETSEVSTFTLMTF